MQSLKFSSQLLVLCATALGACSGELASPNGAGDGVVDPSMPGTVLSPGDLSPDGSPLVDPGPSAFRRLTNTQLDNSVRAILKTNVGLTTYLGSDRSLSAFANGEQQADPSVGIAQGYSSAAAALAEAAVSAGNRAQLFDDSNCAADRAGCVSRFVELFGRVLFRRPLTAEEQSGLVTRASAEVDATGEFWEGARLALEVMLQSVQFLYVIDEGTPLADGTSWLLRSPHSVATKLSLLLWNGAPDEELLGLADSGALQSGDAVAVQVERMLADPRFASSALHFFKEWLGYDLAANASKDPIHVDYQPDLVSSMIDETTRLVDYFVASNLPIMDIFNVDYTFADARVQDFYGTGAPDPTDPTRRALPPERRGILSHASFIAANSGPGNQSPTTRGRGVLTRFICGAVGAPPPFAPAELPEAEDQGPQTIRERTETFMLGNNMCNYCHNHMDRIGFLFEHFDSIGKYRKFEAVEGAPGGQKPVDDSGAVQWLGIDNVQGLPGLAEVLSTRPETAECLTRNVMRWGLGRTDVETDAALVAAMQAQMAAEGGAFRAALRGLAESGALLFMRQPE